MAALALVAIALARNAGGPVPHPDGETLFQSHCAGCHSGAAEARAPTREVLRQRSASAILEVLANGSMRIQGATLSGPERRAIAEYLGGAGLAGDPTGAGRGRCETSSTFSMSGPSWNGWGATLENRRAQSAVAAGLSEALLPRLRLKWAFGFPDATSAWAQPTVVGGWIFVGSQNGSVYALDAKSGCIRWVFSADGGVRTAISVGAVRAGRAAVYFGDTGAKAYALDAASGALLWKTKIEAHPLARITGAPALYRDRLYVPMSSYEESQGSRPEYGCCTFRGSLSSLDARTGKLIWRTYMISGEPKPRGKSSSGVTLYGPAGAPIWSAPTIDAARGLIYVGTGNSYAGSAAPGSDAVVALNLSGKIMWAKQLFANDVFVSGCRAKTGNPNCADAGGPDYDLGNSPILAALPHGRSVIVVGQKSGIGWALDPEKRGEVIWQYRAGAGGALGGIEWGPAVDADHAYFAVSDILSPTPGGLHAVSLQGGERVWFAPPLPPHMCRRPALQRCASRSHQRDSGRRILGIERRYVACLLKLKRRGSMGGRYEP